MATKIAINGFGRIGRCIARVIQQRGVKDLEIVAINDLTDSKTLAHLLKYDSIHCTFGAEVGVDGDHIAIDNKIKIIAERDPAKLPWKEMGVDIALECTGLFRTRDKATLHLDAGAKKVIVSAPAKGGDLTVVMGCNHDKYEAAKHNILSCGSCTTNCLAPPAKVLLDNFGIQRGMLTTIHAYTNDQALLDVPHRKGDLRRARAAAVNMVPSSTGAAQAIYSIFPELEGKFDGMAVRVPTLDVSLVDLTVETEKETNADEVNAAMKKAANEGPLKDVFDYSEIPLVSGDYIGAPASSILDGTLTRVLHNKMVKIFSWYDNEWAFSHRMVDLSRLVGEQR